jgi:hypothetical protein
MRNAGVQFALCGSLKAPCATIALRIRAAALALAATSSLLPLAASAECLTAAAGERCITAFAEGRAEVAARPDHFVQAAGMSSASTPSPLFEVGDVVPRGEYSVILNSEYYGLPPVSDGWVYMRIGRDAFRIDWQSHEVLERVTDETAANY